MGLSSPPDPLLLQAWNALTSQLGVDHAREFFEKHVVGGTEVLSVFWNQQGTGFSAPKDSTHDTGQLQAEPSPEELPSTSTRSTTQIDLSRQMKILDRKWLVTGYVLRVNVPGIPPRRIPLNYRTIRIGHEGSHVDIALALSPGATFQARLAFGDGKFTFIPEGGTVPVLVNGQPVDAACPLTDGDILVAGPVTMRIFHLIEPPAELVVVSGQGAGERFVVDTSQVLMGRFGRRDNDITLQDPTVSREHASIYYQEGKFFLLPETHSSPTLINSEVLSQARQLVDNDQVILGEQTLLFRLRGAQAKPRTLHARTATVLFSDLRGWTPLAEAMPLQDLIAQMDEYFKAMGEIITVHGGTLMTYQGDAIMAVFGAPSSHKDDPWRAAASAVQMQTRLAQLNVEWEKAGRAALRSGIGIHTGLVMVGELGHASRLEYSAMGDTVNLAARLEQLTRDYNCPIIVSEATYQEVGDLLEVQSLGEVTVKGRSHPTRVYSLLNLREAHTV